MMIIIVGCGRMGAKLAQTMVLRGHSVTVIDKDPGAFSRLGPNFKGSTFVGIAFDRDILVQAGIQRADAFAAVTASDEANVVAARLAKNVFRVPRVVARVYEPRKAEIYRRFGLQTISPISLGAERLAELITYSDLDTVFSLGSSEVDIVDLEIPPHLVGRAVKDLTAPGEVHVVAITRAGKTFLPNPGVAFQADDLVHLAVLVAASDRLKSLIR
ncbi:MAG TPA: TrkA family potassium uptake protein [Anaerolineales bacterium]|nr:TrkA family potassium uptake protein [Anaerolineales bacterium]